MILAHVNRNCLTVQKSELLTSGSCRVNEIKFVFSEDWDELKKTAVFKTTKKQISVLLTTDICVVPWEVLSDADESLWVGVYGTKGETVVLPTIWGKLGRVLDGAELGEDAKEPTPNAYAQILLLLDKKLDTPDKKGVAGQVLGLNASGKTVWINQTGGGGTGGGNDITISYDENGEIIAINGDTIADVTAREGLKDKVDNANIADNLTTDDPKRPLSAAQGVALKKMIDDISRSPSTSPGEPGVTPHIGENGHWYIGDEDTGVSAQGPIGDEGKSAYQQAVENGFEGTLNEWLESLHGENGVSPHIGENGNWYVGDEDTKISAKGDPGVTPHIGENGNWYIGDTDTEVSAKGDTGQRGSRWSSGTAITGTSTTAAVFSGTGITDALVNDMYLNTSSGNTYRCTLAGNASTAKWVYVGNIKGANYTLTTADKTEIAEQAAAIIDTSLTAILGDGVIT